jgi:hypothetical protein
MPQENYSQSTKCTHDARACDAEDLCSDEGLPFMVCHLSLFSGGGASSESSSANLYGSLVSSPQVYRDLHGRQGIYFIFPDVSIRTRGHFQIRVSLIRLPRYVEACS